MTTPIITRRNLMVSGAIAGGALLLGERPAMAADAVQPATTTNAAGYTPVVTPNGRSLPFKLVDGVKVFHLIAHELEHEFAPGLKAYCWGYNGSTPGPTIEAVEGDRVRIFVTNRLKSATTVHWHGIILPAGMDGVGGLTQKPIPPGETYKYEFTLKHAGTFMYHSHFDEMTQIAMGMMGMFVVHPKKPEKIDRDFAIMLATWMIHPGTRRPDPMEMNDFNVLTMNSKSFPATQPLVIKTGQRVRIRLGNLSAMDHHPIHLHGYSFTVTGTTGGRIPDSAQILDSTVLVPVGQTRDIEFLADNPGDWVLHCHMTHHMMNMMGHDIPNTIGVNGRAIDEKVQPLLPDYMTMGSGHGHHMKSVENTIPMLGAKGPFGPIDMGGMFTVVKVRDQLNGYEDPGWYQHPAGTVASPATKEELATLSLSR